MASWQDVEADAPELARRVREVFQSGTNKTLATLRSDGSPRISGTELEFWDGSITLGMMPGSRKLRDVQRDPRVAIHSPTVEPPPGSPDQWQGDAKLSGVLDPIDPPADGAFPGAGYFELDVTEMVLVHVEGDKLVIESWHPDRGETRIART